MRSKIPCLAVAAAACVAGVAHAQLREDQVLVVYDSRIADSLAVAEYYAGSGLVPGGAGNLPGVHRHVRVFDLASSGAAVTTPGDISYANFAARVRDPIRAYLTGQGMVRSVRCFAMTKGLPHRVQDTDNTNVGDDPPGLANEVQANDATCASVDVELMLLWQDLSSGENGGSADSRADGLIKNPYWRQSLSINGYTTANIQAAKTYVATGSGPLWVPAGSGAALLTPGDLYLVSRLDAPTAADVRAMIDRAAAFSYNVDAHALLFDESGSNGVADASPNNGELDNSAGLWSALRAADDYETARDLILADGRWLPARVRYNALSGASNFFVGPGRAWPPGNGILVADPVALVASYGSNHSGIPADSNNQSARDFYATTYVLPAGSVFNTIESFNGRDFGGIGQNPFVTQQQLSAFIAAGGTFGVANVWEPLADTIPDNQYLATNFMLGNLSWAEAAWTAIPALSWQQIVVGDPLARGVRSSEDITKDTRLTIEDVYAWEQLASNSPRKDLNRSGTADGADKAFILKSLRAAERLDMLYPRR